MSERNRIHKASELLFKGGGATLERAQQIFHAFSGERFARALRPQVSDVEQMEAAIERGMEIESHVKVSEYLDVLPYIPLDIRRLFHLKIGLDLSPLASEFRDEFVALAQRVSGKELGDIVRKLLPGERIRDLTTEDAARMTIESLNLEIDSRPLIHVFAPKELKDLVLVTGRSAGTRMPDYSHLAHPDVPTDLRLQTAIYFWHLPHKVVEKFLFPSINLAGLRTTNPTEYREKMAQVGRYIQINQLFYILSDTANNSADSAFINHTTPHISSTEECPARRSVRGLDEGIAMLLQENFDLVLKTLTQPAGYFD